MSDDLQEQGRNRDDRDGKGRFVPGVSGNPAGRPKGTRDALTVAFLRALHDEFDKRMSKDCGAVSGLSNEDLCGFVSKVVQKEVTLEAGETFTDLLRRADELLAQRRT